MYPICLTKLVNGVEISIDGDGSSIFSPLCIGQTFGPDPVIQDVHWKEPITPLGWSTPEKRDVNTHDIQQWSQVFQLDPQQQETTSTWNSLILVLCIG